MVLKARVFVTGVEERTARSGNKYTIIGLASGSGADVINVMPSEQVKPNELKRFGEYDGVFRYVEGQTGGRLRLETLTPILK